MTVEDDRALPVKTGNAEANLDHLDESNVRSANDANNKMGKSSDGSKDSVPLRGALRIEVEAATQIVSAGSEFSIYVVIRNPFPVPVTIYSTETHIPIELSDEIWRKQNRNRLHEEHLKKMQDAESRFERWQLEVKNWWAEVRERIRPDPGPRVAIAASPESQAKIVPHDYSVRIGDLEGSITESFISGGDQWHLNFEGVPEEAIRDILWDIDQYQRGKQPILLRPGDSVVQHFILRTTHWLTFTPLGHTFQIQIRYEVDNQKHVDTVPYALSIRAAMGSSLIGAIIGSILGSLVSKQSDFSNTAAILRIFLTSVIFAIIIVVAFVRKSNVQQIISVEDFWGGLFIGFLVGYFGESFINSVLGQTT